jgi:H+/Cl- antiporter ClcA
MNYTKEISHLDNFFLKSLKALLTLGKFSNYIMTTVLSTYMFGAFMMLSVFQVLQSENNPGFSFFHVEDRRSSTMTALLVCLIVLVVTYYGVYITTLALSVRQIFMKDYAAIITFVLN